MIKRTPVILIATIAAFFSITGNSVTIAAEPGMSSWKSFNDGIALAKKNDKKILVDVYTDWCKWCKKMDEEVYANPRIKEYLDKNFVTIKLNAESPSMVEFKGQKISSSQLAQAFGVTGYPATVFLDPDGTMITLLPGFVEAPMFEHVLSYMAESQYTKKRFEDYLKEKGVK